MYCAHLVPSVRVGRSSQYALMIIEFRKKRLICHFLCNFLIFFNMGA